MPKAGPPIINEFGDLLSISSRSASDQIATLLRLGSELDISNDAASARLRNAIGEAALHAYMAHSAQTDSCAIPKVIRKSRLYIEQNFSEECDLNQLARSVGVSKDHLVSAFKKHFGVTPIRYLWEVRTRKAADLVEKTNLNLAEISGQCGYKSQYHLSREIKRLTGLSPREMRKGL